MVHTQLKAPRLNQTFNSSALDSIKRETKQMLNTEFKNLFLTIQSLFIEN